MQDMTAEQLLAMLSQKDEPSTELINSTDYEYNYDYSAEMYSNSNSKKKKNMNKNTFQQSSVNVRGQAPSFSASPAQAPLMREDLKIPKALGIPEDQTVGISENKYGRRLNWQNDKIVEMRLQIGNVRVGDRYKRATAYISIKTETDTRYMIFMKASLTTAIDETLRSIRKDNDKVLQTVAMDIGSEHHNQELFLGRVKYKVTKGQKIQKHHRSNLPLALVGLWLDEGRYYARFHLLGDDYDFRLTDDLSANQKKFYACEGLWQYDDGPLSMNEAFGG
jgi:hypothetical protein